MLRELHISNLAVIEDVSLELSEGLNCFTGQTGAGKSLILGAFEILLGMRAVSSAEVLRPGSEEARVSGVFEVHDPDIAGQLSRLIDQPVCAGEELLITRKLFSSGRSSLSVNGQPATAAMVKAVGQTLVDVHGQHDHQCLLKPSNQLLILDGFAQCLDLREQFMTVHARLRELGRHREELAASGALRRQELDLYEFQVQEIDAASPQAGEWAELQARHNLLGHLEKIKREAGQAHAALYEVEGSVLERLQMISRVLLDLAELDPQLTPIAEQVRTSTLSLQESAFELARHVDRLDLDPAELQEVEQRLNVLNRLIAKYGSSPTPHEDPVAAVLSHRQQLEQKMRRLRGSDEDLGHMERDMAALSRELASMGAKLTEARRKAAATLQPLVEAQLRELGMADAQFVVEFHSADPDDPATPSPASGLDQIDMLVRTNPGQPARPLRKIASGGELSRIMLALKSILAQADRISVLVFDEIDANVGGRLGTVIGQKLRRLAENGRGRIGSRRGPSPAGHQVLCITHLPQIAAFADRHLRISKQVNGKGQARQTRTTVSVLEGQTRIEELAEMLAGKDVTATTRKQVMEMLAAAEA